MKTNDEEIKKILKKFKVLLYLFMIIGLLSTLFALFYLAGRPVLLGVAFIMIGFSSLIISLIIGFQGESFQQRYDIMQSIEELKNKKQQL